MPLFFCDFNECSSFKANYDTVVDLRPRPLRLKHRPKNTAFGNIIYDFGENSNCPTLQDILATADLLFVIIQNSRIVLYFTDRDSSCSKDVEYSQCAILD